MPTWLSCTKLRRHISIAGRLTQDKTYPPLPLYLELRCRSLLGRRHFWTEPHLAPKAAASVYNFRLKPAPASGLEAGYDLVRSRLARSLPALSGATPNIAAPASAGRTRRSGGAGAARGGDAGHRGAALHAGRGGADI